MTTRLTRLYYRLMGLWDRGDELNRRVEVENVLLNHYKNRTMPLPEDCRTLAMRLGVPDWAKRKWR